MHRASTFALRLDQRMQQQTKLEAIPKEPPPSRIFIGLMYLWGIRGEKSCLAHFLIDDLDMSGRVHHVLDNRLQRKSLDS
jgi:hypothetical protein